MGLRHEELHLAHRQLGDEAEARVGLVPPLPGPVGRDEPDAALRVPEERPRNLDQRPGGLGVAGRVDPLIIRLHVDREPLSRARRLVGLPLAGLVRRAYEADGEVVGQVVGVVPDVSRRRVDAVVGRHSVLGEAHHLAPVHRAALLGRAGHGRQQTGLPGVDHADQVVARYAGAHPARRDRERIGARDLAGRLQVAPGGLCDLAVGAQVRALHRRLGVHGLVDDEPLVEEIRDVRVDQPLHELGECEGPFRVRTARSDLEVALLDDQNPVADRGERLIQLHPGGPQRTAPLVADGVREVDPGLLVVVGGEVVRGRGRDDLGRAAERPDHGEFVAGPVHLVPPGRIGARNERLDVARLGERPVTIGLVGVHHFQFASGNRDQTHGSRCCQDLQF